MRGYHRKASKVALAGALVMLAASCSGAGGNGAEASDNGGDASTGETFEFKVADWLPTDNPISREGAQFWMDRVSELTEDRVTFRYFPAEQLSKGNDLLGAVNSGLTDIALVAPGYNSDKLGLATAGQLPGLFTDACHGTSALWDLFNEGGITDENSLAPNGVRALFLTATPQYELLTNKPVLEPGDAAGVKVRSAGGTGDLTIKAIDGVPVNISAPDMYQAIKLGTVDGTSFPYSNAISYSIEEVVKYGTVGAGLGSFIDLYAIDLETWKSIPSDLQDVMIEAGEETNAHLCQALIDENDDAISQMEAANVEVAHLTEADIQKWQEATAPVQEEWASKMPDPDEANRTLESLREALETHAQE